MADDPAKECGMAEHIAGLTNGSEQTAAGRQKETAEPGRSADRTDMERYSRQIRFAPIGPEGQRRLLEASVLIVGAGALGASLAQHMARAGVGRIRIVDRDFVEPSNLQRQTLFDEEDARLALPKAAAAAAKLRRINSGIAIEEHVADVTSANAAALAEGVQLVLDGTDNAATRLLMSDVCFALGIPFLYGGAVGASGMSAALVPGETACLRCLIGGDQEAADAGTCETEGVISPIVELVAALQAAEALKWLTGRRESLRRTWISASLWPSEWREWRLPGPSRDCAVCGRAKPPAESGLPMERAEAGLKRLAVREEASAAPSPRPTAGPIRAAVLCGRDTVQLTLDHPLPLERIEERLRADGCIITRNPWLIRAETGDGRRFVVFRGEGRVLVQGVSDAEEAVRGLTELLHQPNEEGVTVR
ncbi:ThiF family adenylyltransferase [Thermobacillus xylanilyticus]|nr:ThiF family adenylyltransferase [Thermobacillus xylanilyticus]